MNASLKTKNKETSKKESSTRKLLEPLRNNFHYIIFSILIKIDANFSCIFKIYCCEKYLSNENKYTKQKIFLKVLELCLKL